jgi:hypothetical protein
MQFDNRPIPLAGWIILGSYPNFDNQCNAHHTTLKIAAWLANCYFYLIENIMHQITSSNALTTRQRREQNINMTIMRFLNKKLSKDGLEKLYDQLSANGKSYMAVQLLKYMQTLQLAQAELERTRIERLPTEQLEQIINTLRNQRMIEVNITDNE